MVNLEGAEGFQNKKVKEEELATSENNKILLVKGENL